MSLPKSIRQQVRDAVDAINAHQRGLSVPRVCLAYRFDPIQALVLIAMVCRSYGRASVAQWVPQHFLSLVELEHPGLISPANANKFASVAPRR